MRSAGALPYLPALAPDPRLRADLEPTALVRRALVLAYSHAGLCLSCADLFVSHDRDGLLVRLD